MTEHKEIIERLLRKDVKDEKTSEQKLVRRSERIRIAVEREARIIARIYNDEFKGLKPAALESYEEISRWYTEELRDSGLLETLSTWKKGKIFSTEISDIEPDHFPKKVLDELFKTTKTKPFKDFYTFFGREETDNEIIEQIVLRFQREHWRARIAIAHPNAYEGFHIRYSDIGFERSFGHQPTKLEIRFNNYPTDVNQLLENLHPQVLIRFARDIREKKVWERIEKAIKGEK